MLNVKKKYRLICGSKRWEFCSEMKTQKSVWITQRNVNKLDTVGYKSQVRSDPPIIFLPIINVIFVIISKLRFRCPVYQFYITIHCLINIRQKIFLFSMLLDLIFKQFSVL